MAEKDIIAMSRRDLRRLKIIQEALERHITQLKAAEIAGLSGRQMRRLIARIRKEGDEGILHRSRGKRSHRAIPKRVKAKVLELCQGEYKNFGPTFASEKLEELEMIRISRETVRGWFIEEEIPYAQRKGRPHREWRERRHCFGDLLQMDGSHHDWFEGRGPKCVLMGYIDDATGNVYALFYPYEGTFSAMDSTLRYIRKYGIPMNIYQDRHQTYKSNREPTIEEQLNNKEPSTQYKRAVEEIGINVIHALSPQAKGRIERLFRTFQDRLVKETRLRGISTIEDANAFLEEYLPRHNKRFAVPPREDADLHRPLSPDINIDSIFCIKTERALRNDFTVAHNRKLYQIDSNLRANKVVVEDRLDGSVKITHKGKELIFREILTRPLRENKTSLDRWEPRRIYIPPADHPWRRYPTKITPRLVASPVGDRSL